MVLIQQFLDRSDADGLAPARAALEQVNEFDLSNNQAASEVTLPRLDAGLEVVPASLEAGDDVTLTLSLENLQAGAALPVTVSVNIRSPLGTVVYSRIWNLTLTGGETRQLTDTWSSGEDAAAGGYSVLQEVEDAYGTRTWNNALFVVNGGPVGYYIYLPLVVR
jgi:hypothetical protein